MYRGNSGAATPGQRLPRRERRRKQQAENRRTPPLTECIAGIRWMTEHGEFWLSIETAGRRITAHLTPDQAAAMVEYASGILTGLAVLRDAPVPGSGVPS
jgi:hypothetical protein